MGSATPFIASGIMGLMQGLTTPKPNSFSGTAVDPVAMMQQLKNILTGAVQQQQERVSNPVQFPDAFVSPLPTFNGGGLPGPIGMFQSTPPGMLGEGVELDPDNTIGPIGSWKASDPYAKTGPGTTAPPPDVQNPSGDTMNFGGSPGNESRTMGFGGGGGPESMHAALSLLNHVATGGI